MNDKAYSGKTKKQNQNSIFKRKVKQMHQSEDFNLLPCCGIRAKQRLSNINEVPAKEHFHASSSCKTVRFVRFLLYYKPHLNANPDVFFFFPVYLFAYI